MQRSSTGRDLFKGMAKKKDKERKREAPPTILLGEHGRYQIKSGRLAGEFVARAFPKPPAKAQGLIAEATGATEEAAIAALREMIDARESHRAEGRRTDAQTGSAVPSPDEYREAIRQIPFSGPQQTMLTALSLAGGDGLSEERMTRAAGYRSRASASRAFAGAGILIANYLSMKAAPNGPSMDPDGTSLLGFRGVPQGDEDPGNWIMHPELRDAIRDGVRRGVHVTQ